MKLYFEIVGVAVGLCLVPITWALPAAALDAEVPAGVAAFFEVLRRDAFPAKDDHKEDDDLLAGLWKKREALPDEKGDDDTFAGLWRKREASPDKKGDDDTFAGLWKKRGASKT